MHFEIYQESPGLIRVAQGVLASKEWRWRLVATNGKNIANGGESYHNKADCLHGIDLVKGTNASTPVKEIDS